MPGALGALPGRPRARVREVILIMDTWPRSERFIGHESEINGIGGERAPLSANSVNSATLETQSSRSGSTAGTALNAPPKLPLAGAPEMPISRHIRRARRSRLSPFILSFLHCGAETPMIGTIADA